MTTPPDLPPCPQCGGALDLDTHAEVESLWLLPRKTGLHQEPRRRPAAVLACTRCEFVRAVR